MLQNTLQVRADVTAIGLAALCAAHCLLVPILLVLSPQFSQSLLADEHVHQWLLMITLPLSSLALLSGCQHHKKRGLLVIAAAAIALLILAIFSHDFGGHWLETSLTLAGSLLLISVHIMNHRLCK